MKNKLKLGLSNCGGHCHDLAQTRCDLDAFIKYKEAGIDVIEVSYSSSYKGLDFDLIKKNSQISGLELWSFHLPFAPNTEVDISSQDKDIFKNTIKVLSEYTKQAGDAGFNCTVIHPSSEPIEDKDRAEKMKIAKEGLATLAEVSAKEGLTLCVEDLPRTCLGRNSTEIKDLISADDRLRVCFDTNHLLQEEIKDFIKNVGDKIYTLHVSDYDRVDERHWLPGEGIIDWAELIGLLDEFDYKNPFVYELGFVSKTANRSRGLTYSDFYDNFNLLMTEPEKVKNLKI